MVEIYLKDKSTKDIDSFKNIEITKTHSFVTDKFKIHPTKEKVYCQKMN